MSLGRHVARLVMALGLILSVGNAGMAGEPVSVAPATLLPVALSGDDPAPQCLPRAAAEAVQQSLAAAGVEVAQSIVCCCPTSSGECCNYVRGPYCGPRVPGCPCGR